MAYLEMLGETVILLGKIPRFLDPFVQVSADIKGKQDAIRQYQAHIQIVHELYI